MELLPEIYEWQDSIGATTARDKNYFILAEVRLVYDSGLKLPLYFIRSQVIPLSDELKKKRYSTMEEGVTAVENELLSYNRKVKIEHILWEVDKAEVKKKRRR